MKAGSILNLLAILAGIAALASFFLQPWLVVTTPVVELVHEEVDAPTIASIGGWLTGGCLSTIWLVPLAAGVLVLTSALGLGSKGGGQRAIGTIQILATSGIGAPLIIVWSIYVQFLGVVSSILPTPEILSPGSFFVPGRGFYITVICCVICLAAGIVNVRGS